MPKRILTTLLTTTMLILVSCGTPEPPPAATEKPTELEPGGVRLILVLVADQCAAQYIERFGPLFSGGLEMLVSQGTSFTEAHHFHAVTATAVGHATLATGCYPARHGIVGNSWYDKQTGERVYALDDEEYDRSPAQMLSPALGSWLKAAAPKARVFAASGKDRAAILMAGHDADGAFWYQKKTGAYESSEFYYPDGEPAWVEAFNQRRHLDRHFHEAWEPLPVGPEALEAAGIGALDFGPLHGGFPHVFGVTSPAPERWFYETCAASPWNDELLALFGRELIEAEGLGMNSVPDVLFLSFSALDWVGHDYGPQSREVLDTILRLDQNLAGLFQFIDDRIGLDQTLITFTGDHGVAPVPEYQQTLGKAGSRIDDNGLLCFHQTERLMDERYGRQDWFRPGPYLDPSAVEGSGVPREELEESVAAILGNCPAVDQVWTRADLLGDPVADDPYYLFYRNNYNEGRSPDFMVQFRETHLHARYAATTHGTPHRHDTHVPLLLMGPGVPAGVLHERVHSVDLAPTLAALAGIPVPEEIDGHSLVPRLEEVRVVLEEVELAAAEPVAAVEPSTP